MTALERAAALMAILRQSCSGDGRCPTDAELAAQLDCTEEQLGDAFAFLEAGGLIDWRRVVTIRAAQSAEAA